MTTGLDEFQDFAPEFEVLPLDGIKFLPLEKIFCQEAFLEALGIIVCNILVSAVFLRAVLNVYLPEAQRFPNGFQYFSVLV